MKTHDLIAAISLFAENEILPGIRNEMIKFSLGGALGVLAPVIANNFTNGGKEIDYALIENFVRSGFAYQPTLKFCVRDFLPDNWETTYPLLRFGPFPKVINFAFEIDKEAGETFLKYCNNGTHTSSASPSTAASSVPPQTL
jgi:hypothetical protein